ncbi:Non-hem dioxygenase N-terminal domain [Dillenia turbinata]|uniref:Non-hem dioxygenase N-terminal domain n=1 Tax=Dillenia turbinata TaxID=194707 RepID=A0AAN8ZCE4_9MAGN
MVLTNSVKVHAELEEDYDRTSELKALVDSRLGVKGLVDAGITKVPWLFVHQPDKLYMQSDSEADSDTPIINLKGINKDPVLRAEIIDRVRDASEKWGFFQVINHGIPESVLDEMINGVLRFFDLVDEVKKELYSRDPTRKFFYSSNPFPSSTPAGIWCDTVACPMAPEPIDPELIPAVCSHTDICVLTVLLQNEIGGLQFLHENHWVDVPPIHGALTLLSNDKFRSAKHRVLSKSIGPRISVPSFFRPTIDQEDSARRYGPIKELLSEIKPPVYREIKKN